MLKCCLRKKIWGGKNLEMGGKLTMQKQQKFDHKIKNL